MGAQMLHLKILNSSHFAESSSWRVYWTDYRMASLAFVFGVGKHDMIRFPFSVMPMVSWYTIIDRGSPSWTIQLVPTVNGYKRLVGGEAFWAPNAVTYGYDARGCSVRIISPPSVPPAATRFEVRVPGADMNPYFALTAIFKLGLRGIERQMKLTIPPVSVLQKSSRKEVSA